MMNSPTEESILDEISSIKKGLMQSMRQFASIGNPQVTSINLELQQLVRDLERLKDDTKSHFANQQKRINILDNQRKQLAALTVVGSAINSSLDRNDVLNKVLDELIVIMKAEKGFLMLKDEKGDFHVEIARNAQKRNLTENDFLISKSIVRRVLENGEAVLTSNAQEDSRFKQQASVAAFQLLSILCAPLKVKDELIGVIYVDNRAQSGIFSKDDLELISAFANQAAVAIDNAATYQATLEGWVRALDLRDKETEGHTKRVTQLTEILARKMDVDGDSLVHIQRGALLHDIGKMAIPDGILLKPAALTPEERAIIQKHPVYAFEMLNPIHFLHPALDIPYCHHEKWDGSGYPRGLKGEDIPLAARIFAVVDVWDALVSDRPYRKGLDPIDVKQKIREDAGKHFDPHVVDAFLKLDGQTISSAAKIG
ncbi:MAG: HD-GYP domain-containing protein [Anaerolineae bacterium]